MEEIRRSPVEVGSLSHYLQGFSTIPGGAGYFSSTVCFVTFVEHIMFRRKKHQFIVAWPFSGGHAHCLRLDVFVKFVSVK